MEESIIGLISGIKNQWLVLAIGAGYGVFKFIKPLIEQKTEQLIEERKQKAETEREAEKLERKTKESVFELLVKSFEHQISSTEKMTEVLSGAISAGFEKVCSTFKDNFSQNHNDHDEIKTQGRHNHEEIKNILNQHSDCLKEIKNKLNV